MADLLPLAERLALDAGALLLRRLPELRTDVVAKSTPTDVASEVDRAAEDLIVSALRRVRPDDAILAEEGTYDTGSSGLRWVVDPLDGTVNYLYRAAAFGVSVGVEDAGGGLAGAVYDPQRDELFSGARGTGSAVNGTPLRANDVTDLAQALVATGFSYDAVERAWQASVLTTVLPRVRDIRRGGSAALDMVAVAAGRVDAYFELGPAPWDRCAALVVAAEAGARTLVGTTPSGAELTVVAAPGVYDALLALLREAGALA
jgi:myo-inositol-1(or 4)-monophosphatase